MFFTFAGNSSPDAIKTVAAPIDEPCSIISASSFCLIIKFIQHCKSSLSSHPIPIYSPSLSITVANIDNEAEKIIEENKKNEKQLANEWSETIENKKVEVKAKDGITLRGTQYIKDESSNKWAIILHGYRSTPNSIISIGMHF